MALNICDDPDLGNSLNEYLLIYFNSDVNCFFFELSLLTFILTKYVSWVDKPAVNYSSKMTFSSDYNWDLQPQINKKSTGRGWNFTIMTDSNNFLSVHLLHSDLVVGSVSPLTILYQAGGFHLIYMHIWFQVKTAFWGHLCNIFLHHHLSNICIWLYIFRIRTMVNQ